MLRRDGFTLIAVVVLVAVLAIGAAVVVPALGRANARSRAVEVRNEADLIFLGLDRARNRMGRHAGHVHHLMQQPVLNDSTGCAQFMTGRDELRAGDVSNWPGINNLHATYNRRRFVRKKNGAAFVIGLGFGVVNDSIFRTSETNAYLKIANVAEPDATELDALVDAGNGSATGRIQWDAPTQGYTTVRYSYTPAQVC